MNSDMASQGVFVSVDGPGGVGKSTAVRLAAEQLAQRGFVVHPTTEPTPTPLGELIRAGTDIYQGMALACLVAGDRHHHLASEIRPQRANGAIVVCDRYIPSSLVLQRMDGLDWETIWELNSGADRPDIAVILNADATVIARRLASRGGHSRFERLPHSSEIESGLYGDTATRLTEIGWPMRVIDCTARTTTDVAAILVSLIVTAHVVANRSAHEHHQQPVPADVQHR
jgi:dTMP kinase